MSDKQNGILAAYGSLEPTLVNSSVKLLKPVGRFQELTVISINESPLNQGNGDDESLGLEDSLFHYMDDQISHVETKLKQLKKMEHERQPVDGNLSHGGKSKRHVSLNDDDFLEVDEDHFKVDVETKFLTIEIEREHFKSVGESLQKLKHEILRLRTHLQSECTKLDLLDTLSAPGDQERAASKQRLLMSRLNKCLVETTRRIEDVLRKNNLMVDGVRKNKGHLENPVNEKIRSSPIGCVTRLHIMLFVTLLGAMTFMYLWSKGSDKWTLYLRLLRSPLLVVLLLFLYGVNMKVWAKYGVDFATILSHPPMSTPTPRYVFKMASILTVLLTLLVIGAIVATPFSTKLPLKVTPLLMWLLLFGFLLNPLNIFKKRARFSFLCACLRILSSPFIFVYFSDFFLADQFNSSIAIFLDIEYLICYLTTDPWSGTDINRNVCMSSANGIRPIVSLLPASWRFLQCLRCFYDTYNPKHLVNAGKYFSFLPVVVFAALIKVDAPWVIICWYASAFIHGVYTFLWDITGDWGLMTIKCAFFQRKLAYGYKAVYVLALMLDLMLRFFWSIKLSMAVVGEKSELLFTGMLRSCSLAIYQGQKGMICHTHFLEVTPTFLKPHPLMGGACMERVKFEIRLSIGCSYVK